MVMTGLIVRLLQALKLTLFLKGRKAVSLLVPVVLVRHVNVHVTIGCSLCSGHHGAFSAAHLSGMLVFN